MHTPLVPLPNLRAVIPALGEAFARPAGVTGAFYLLELNGLDEVNDRHGQVTADAVSRAAVQRIRAVAPENDLIAMIGGVEFAIVARRVQNQSEAFEICRRYVEAFEGAVCVGNRAHNIGVTVGFALYPDDGTTAEEIIHRADLALFGAKAEWKSNLLFFEAMSHVPAV